MNKWDTASKLKYYWQNLGVDIWIFTVNFQFHIFSLKMFEIPQNGKKPTRLIQNKSYKTNIVSFLF